MLHSPPASAGRCWGHFTWPRLASPAGLVLPLSCPRGRPSPEQGRGPVSFSHFCVSLLLVTEEAPAGQEWGPGSPQPCHRLPWDSGSPRLPPLGAASGLLCGLSGVPSPLWASIPVSLSGNNGSHIPGGGQPGVGGSRELGGQLSGAGRRVGSPRAAWGASGWTILNLRNSNLWEDLTRSRVSAGDLRRGSGPRGGPPWTGAEEAGQGAAGGTEAQRGEATGLGSPSSRRGSGRPRFLLLQSLAARVPSLRAAEDVESEPPPGSCRSRAGAYIAAPKISGRG